MGDVGLDSVGVGSVGVGVDGVGVGKDGVGVNVVGREAEGWTCMRCVWRPLPWDVCEEAGRKSPAWGPSSP